VSLIDPVGRIAKRAAEKILDVYQGSFAVESKDDRSPLTQADRYAHAVIVDGLAQLTPGLPVLSEESKLVPFQERSGWRQFWLVDPLDGTREFVKRNGEFTVNIALIDSHVPVLGIVQVPVTGVVYQGIRGNGAWKEAYGRRTAIHARGYRGGRATVVASRSHRGEDVDRYLARLEALEGPYDTASLGSSLKLCMVAEGAADIYPRLGPTSEWDTAAAQCVVEAAGGKVIQLNGQPLVYNKPDILNPWFLVTGAGDFDWLAFLDDAT